MRNSAIISNAILLIGIFLVLLTPVYADNNRLPDPKIQAGIAKVFGQVTNFHLKAGEEAPILTLYIPNPITAETGIFKTNLSEDGSFNFEIPIECSTTVGTIVSDIFNNCSLNFYLTANGETKLEIIYDEAGKIKAKMVNRQELTSDDVINLGDVLGKMIDHQSPENTPRYNMLIEDLIPFQIKSMERKLNIANNDSLLSENGKILITNEFKLIYMNYRFFDYKECMRIDYMRYNDEKDWDNYIPREPGRSYYIFLKYFNLNDPQYLYNGTYPEVLQTILSNKTLNIPAINDTPIQDWLKEVKTIMTDLIGSDTGLFYEMLAANAYSHQFIKELKPLSDKQIENIRSYFKNEEITKILLMKNEKIIRLYNENKQIKSTIETTPVVSKEASVVPKDALMNAILSKYKGKAVVVDFWATWCGPCMAAMKEIREVKTAMKDKEVVFLNITGASSPKDLWKENIKIIGGEHYYLTKQEWDYLLDNLGFDSIPTYLFYDANGVLKNKVTGYPGTENMLKMINELLP